MNRIATMLALVSLLGLAAGQAIAEEHEVKMLNKDGKGKFMLFEPEFLKVAVGDIVRFVVVDKSHNAEMIPEVWPEGAEPFKGEFNEEAELVIEKPGLYGIKCRPHYTMGMVALIVAGEPTNMEQLKSYKAPGGARKRFKALADQVEK